MPTRRPTLATALAIPMLAFAGAAPAADKSAAPSPVQPQTRPGSPAITRPDLVVTIEGVNSGLRAASPSRTSGLPTRSPQS